MVDVIVPEMDAMDWKLRLVKLLGRVIWGVARNPDATEATTNDVPFTSLHEPPHYTGMILIAPQKLEMRMNCLLRLLSTRFLSSYLFYTLEPQKGNQILISPGDC